MNTVASMLEGGLQSWPGWLGEGVQDVALRQKRSKRD